jgi:peptide/nickel transport system permease protein
MARLLSHKTAAAGFLVLCLFAMASLAAPLISSHDPLEMKVPERLRAPGSQHWMGTDQFGRDLFSRIVHGGRVSLGVGGAVTLLSVAFGLVLGLYAGYYRALDALLMRICDGLMAAPGILLAIALMSAFGPSAGNVVIALTLVYTPGVARIVRSSALKVREQNYVDAIRLQGASPARIIWRHIAPNTLSPLIVQASYIFAGAIISEAGLSFLGAGIPAPAPSWGNIVHSGKLLVFKAWWIVVFPSLMIVLAVLSLNLIGDGLSDWMDPHHVALVRRKREQTRRRDAAPTPDEPGSPDARELLRIDGLKTRFLTEAGELTAVNGLDLFVRKGEFLGLVGESGCGKSVTAQSILRLYDERKGVSYEGAVHFDGRDLLRVSASRMSEVRGMGISMVFQDPLGSLDPVFTVGSQIVETIRRHRRVTADEAARDAERLLALTGIPSPKERMKSYPHELSGGMQQRVMIAMALSCRSKLLIADEPTTALDVTVQAQILDLVRRLGKETGMAALFITHDLGIVSELCDRVAVMYLGRIVEEAETKELFARPSHPYTQGLLTSIPPMKGRSPLHIIPGAVPSLLEIPAGCPFADRCDRASERCRREFPDARVCGAKHSVRCWNAGTRSMPREGGRR